LKEKLTRIRERIAKAAKDCGRDPRSVHLVAVSKTMPAEKVKEAIEAGVDILGENYIQEARDKISKLSDHTVSWHFIGHLQSNKAKYAVKLFDVIHSVDSVKLVREIDKQAKKNDKVQKILLQVNIAGEDQKSGVKPVEIPNLLKEISERENVSVLGMMTMPPFFDDPEKARPFFRQLREMRDMLQQKFLSQLDPSVSLDELSMGMSGDFEAAIEEGATLVRVGTAIFGERK
jgi:pyridoxal phosphate enzyme (YggS family)